MSKPLRTDPDHFYFGPVRKSMLFDRESALNDEDFWVKVSKERAEFKESKVEKAIPLNQGVYKECITFLVFKHFQMHDSN